MADIDVVRKKLAMRLLTDGGRFARTDERRAEQFKTVKPADKRLTRPWAAGGGAIVGARSDRGGDEGDGHSSRANLRAASRTGPAGVPTIDGARRTSSAFVGLAAGARGSPNKTPAWNRGLANPVTGSPGRFRTFVDLSSRRPAGIRGHGADRGDPPGSDGDGADRGDPTGSDGAVPIAATRRDRTGRCVPECR
jgi:hypothetical protein